MFSHSDIWRGIDRLAESFGYSPSGLAKKAGLDPTSFNKSKRMSPEGKHRWPSTESIAKILQVTGATMSDFISLIDDEADSHAAHARNVQIPMIGFAKAGYKGFFDDDGYPTGNGWGSFDFPGQRQARSGQIFALEVTGQSLKPLYRKGDTIILAAGTPIRKGDRVALQTRQGDVLAKEILKKTSHYVDLGPLIPSQKPQRINLTDIRWIARILWASQ